MQIAGYNVAEFLRDSVADRLNNVSAREVNVKVVDQTHVDAFFTTQAGQRYGYRMVIQPDTTEAAKIHTAGDNRGDRVPTDTPTGVPQSVVQRTPRQSTPPTVTTFDVLVEIRDLMVEQNEKLDNFTDVL